MDMTLTKTRIRAGVWEGVLSGAADPAALEVLLLGQAADGCQPSPPCPTGPANGLVRVPIPAEALSEGVQTFIIRDKASGEKLAHFTIITGVAMEDDMRAEVDLLRAELDMLKRAFRRHCLETVELTLAVRGLTPRAPRQARATRHLRDKPEDTDDPYPASACPA